MVEFDTLIVQLKVILVDVVTTGMLIVLWNAVVFPEPIESEV